ncbi:MAG: outer rane adhesin like protein, partial [Thermoleophilia bacterium]|nr:outer rane adhesin like protein [Thermoleophilia bacterium]
ELSLICTDVDGDPLTYTVTTAPGATQGLLTPGGGNLGTFQPASNFHGPVALVAHATDGRLTSADVAITVTVTSVNDLPSCSTTGVTVAEDAPVDVPLSCSDVEGDTMTYQVTQPAHGSVSVSGATATYTPAANFTGSDAFTVAASDGTGAGAAVTQQVSVTAVNDRPACSVAAAAVAEDIAGAVSLACTDVDGDPLTLTITEQPAHGAASLNGTTATYTPARDYTGPDAFAFTASDGTLTSASASATLVVTAVNDVPTCTALPATTTSTGVTTEVPLRCTDADPGDVLAYAVGASPAHGAESVAGAVATFVPEAGFSGDDSFLVTVSDGSTTASLLVRVRVRAPLAPAPDPTPTPAPTPDAVPAAPAGGAANTQTPDTTAPSCSVVLTPRQRLATVASKGLSARATCSEASTALATLTVDARTARALGLQGPAATRIGATTLRLAKGRASQLRVPLTPAARSRIKRVKVVRVTLTVVSTDAAGNSGTRRVAVTLR